MLSLIPAGYLAGSVPFGLMVGLCRGIDVRKAGSGNIGATNVGRLLGRKFFILVFLLDMLKGLAPMVAGGAVLHVTHRELAGLNGPTGYAIWLGIGLSTIVGHMFSIFLAFRGGKGVATSTGVALGLYPFFTMPILISAAVWGIVLWRTRIMSIASIVGTLTLPISYIAIGLACHWPILGDQWPLLAFVMLIAGLIIFQHRGNIARLRSGSEHRAIPANKIAVTRQNGDGRERKRAPGRERTDNRIRSFGFQCAWPAAPRAQRPASCPRSFPSGGTIAFEPAPFTSCYSPWA